MIQKVKNSHFTACVLIDSNSFNDGLKIDAVALPSGAEVLSVNVEVKEAAKTGVTADVGLNDSANVFLSEVKLDTKANLASSVVTDTSKPSIVTFSVSEAITQGLFKLRVHYANPSEISHEI